MEILKNPTSKLLFITAELYQERSIDDAQKRSLKGKHCSRYKKQKKVNVIFGPVFRAYIFER